ncbi:MAG TPA: hypothetical protein VIG48_12640 [Jatrophihabitans sp.]|jgi:hypothetical protein
MRSSSGAVVTLAGGVLAAVLACAAVLIFSAPAEASTTVEVQLTLSGLASPDNPTGGAQVGVHPGDSVIMHASAVPTAGAPAGLSGALSGLVSGVAGLQVKILDGNLPGVHYPFTLGKVAHCGGKPALSLRSLAKGTYSFHYVVQKMSLLSGLLGGIAGCKKTTVTPTRDQLGKLTKNNVKVTDNAVYSGSIVVATKPPAGGIGVQLPSQSISAKVGPIHTSVNLPGATVSVPNPLPGVTSGLPKPPGGLGGGNGGSNPGGSHGGSGNGNINYTPPALTVPQQVMPHAVNYGGKPGTSYKLPQRTVGGHVVAPLAPTPSVTLSPVSHPSEVANAEAGKNTVNLADGSGLGKQLPIILAILAILALSVVTAGYTRMVLLRKN